MVIVEFSILIFKKLEIPTIRENMEQLEFSYVLAGHKALQPLYKNVLPVSTKPIYLNCNPPISNSGIEWIPIPKESKVYIH